MRKYTQEEIEKNMFGRIYVNKDDTNIFVKRKGLYSYTMNFGNKWTYVIISAELLAIFIICLLSYYL